MQSKKKYLLWGFLLVVLTFAALNRHSRSKPFHYSSQIMSDKAGYYVYLPALFLYEFKSSKFPTKVDSLTGDGFQLNLKDNEVHSKYPVGVAVLVSPFFILAHVYSVLTDKVADGFSIPYQNAIDIAGVFYLLLGLYFLNKFLLNYCSQKVVIVSLASLFLGSNLYYYTIFEGGYSHVYTLFLFSIWLYNLKAFEKTKGTKYWLQLFAIASFIILVRQINLAFIFLSIGLFSSPQSFYAGKTAKDWLKGLGMAIAIFTPQLFYNIYLTQTPFTYSYQNEGFIYWLNPKWIEVLFGFENGWLITSPVLILSITGLIFLYKNHKKSALIILLITLICTYIYASWWAYKLGCSFGHRGFVDIYPFLSLPYTVGLSYFLLHKKSFLKILITIVLFTGVFLNLKYTYTYDSCWPISTELSDFEIYWHFISSPTK
jgi:hypothetical protein